MQLKSKSFENGKPIPPRHTGEGADVSPPLEWTDVPEGTRAFALICDDPDAPAGTWVHWVLYDVPAATRSLPEGTAAAETVLGTAKQGMTDFRRIGYGGPMPPPGKPHRYSFRLYALDQETGLKPGATKAQVMKAIQGHVLAQAELMGTYKR